MGEFRRMESTKKYGQKRFVVFSYSDIIFITKHSMLLKLYELLMTTNDTYTYSTLPVKGRMPMFVSVITLEGFSVPILSVIDLVEMLFDEYEFKYVLTGKFNQDCVEITVTFTKLFLRARQITLLHLRIFDTQVSELKIDMPAMFRHCESRARIFSTTGDGCNVNGTKKQAEVASK
jgi:hypothetical protein